MPCIYYPSKWIRQSPLIALPGKFCCSGGTNVRKATLDFFLEGHPLHLLTRKVCLVCDSETHSAVCPNNITCLFDDGDFEMVYEAIVSERSGRPNLNSELESWARRAIVCDPASVLRIMGRFPDIRPAVAAAIKRKRQLDGCLSGGPASIVYNLIGTGHISLDLISVAWINTAQQTLGPTVLWPGTKDIEAFAALGLWARYLEGSAMYTELTPCLRNQININIALLCTPSFTELPVLPPEIGKLIMAALRLRYIVN